MNRPLNILSQDELFRVLRNMLKTTQNELLPNITKRTGVKALFEAIAPITWKLACEKHFSLVVEEGKELDPKAIYLEKYPQNRFVA